MALPFSTPPETGLSGPLRTGVAACTGGAAAGASPSDLTAGPSPSGTFTEEAAGALVIMLLSSEASISGAAVLRAGADFAASAVGGLGCAGVVLLELLAGVCGFETGCGCVLAAAVFGAVVAGALLEVAGLCVAAGAGAPGCDIFARTFWSR